MPQKGIITSSKPCPLSFASFLAPPGSFFVGDGPLESELKGLAGQLGVSDQCRFLSFRTDIPELLASLIFLCWPSLWKASPSPCIEKPWRPESRSSPTNIKGNREVIDHGVNRVCWSNPGDPAALAEGIIHLIRDKEKDPWGWGRGPGRRARKCFSEEAMGPRGPLTCTG